MGGESKEEGEGRRRRRSSWRRDQKVKLSCDAVSLGPYLTPDSFEAGMTLHSCPQLWPGDQAFILPHLSAIARWPLWEEGVALSRWLSTEISPPGSRWRKASFSSTPATETKSLVLCQGIPVPTIGNWRRRA